MPDSVSRIIATDNDEEQGVSGSRTTNFLPDFNRYSDRVQEELSDDGGDGDDDARAGARRAIEGGVQKVRNTLTDENGEGSRDRESDENAWLRS